MYWRKTNLYLLCFTIFNWMIMISWPRDLICVQISEFIVYFRLNWFQELFQKPLYFRGTFGGRIILIVGRLIRLSIVHTSSKRNKIDIFDRSNIDCVCFWFVSIFAFWKTLNTACLAECMRDHMFIKSIFCKRIRSTFEGKLSSWNKRKEEPLSLAVWTVTFVYRLSEIKIYRIANCSAVTASSVMSHEFEDWKYCVYKVYEK